MYLFMGFALLGASAGGLACGDSCCCLQLVAGRMAHQSPCDLRVSLSLSLFTEPLEQQGQTLHGGSKLPRVQKQNLLG